MPQFYLSNRLDILYERFKANAFGRSVDPLQSVVLVVPHQDIGVWLKKRFADDPDCGVFFGIEIILWDDYASPLSKNALALSVDCTIRNQIGLGRWKPLADYVMGPESDRLSDRALSRVAEVSFHVAQNFLNNFRISGTSVSNWEVPQSQDWQKELYQIVFHEEQITVDPRTHFFGFSYLPRRYQVGWHYILSPCTAFWCDVRSYRERRGILKAAEDAGDAQKLTLEELLADTNPLLANWGKVGREYAKQIDETNAFEQYEIPRCIAEHPEYSELLLPSIVTQESSNLSLLMALQADILLMRVPGEIPLRIELDRQSCQCHTAPTRLREVEAVYQSILRLFEQKGRALDVLVLAKDISVYQPWIERVFGEGDPKLPFSILDRYQTNSLTETFGLILQIAYSRFSISDVEKLLDSPSFIRASGWSHDDAEQLRTLIRRSGIDWGYDYLDQKSRLEKEGYETPFADTSGIGTWKWGLERILKGLVVRERPNFEGISLSKAELIGEFEQQLRRLHRLLDTLASSERELSEFGALLIEVVETFLKPSGVEEEDEQQLLIQRIDRLTKGVEGTFSFLSIKKPLFGLLGAVDVGASSQVNPIRFANMDAERVIPSDIICLLGLSEEQFPEKTSYSSIDIHLGQNFYFPTTGEQDRYLFLQALLQAKEALILSATVSEEDQSSVVVSELLSYVDRSFVMEGVKPSTLISHSHPLTAFEDTQPPDELNFWAGRALDTSRPNTFFSEVGSQEVNKPDSVSIRELRGALKNPIKNFFSKGLEFSPFKREGSSGCRFTFDPLERFLIREKSLREPLQGIFEEEHARGRLPLGMFESLAKEQLQFEIEDRQKRWREIGCGEALDIELNVDQVVCRGVAVTGRLTTICVEGVMCQDVTPNHFPGILLDCVLWGRLAPLFGLEAHPVLFDLKRMRRLEVNPIPSLEVLLDFYLATCHHPIPLFPEWIEPLLEDSALPQLDTPYWSQPVTGALRESLKMWCDKLYGPLYRMEALGAKV